MSKVFITEESETFLSDIKNLWRRNSARLGFFPDGAFEEYCTRKQILVAHSEKNGFQGYLLFRRSRQTTVIVHLCLRTQCRSAGTARLLVDKLKEISSDSTALTLKCRRDYDLEGFWSTLGFIALHEVNGKGNNAAPLTVWRMELCHLDLFLSALTQRLETKSTLVIDANIFYGLFSASPSDSEAKSLLADWVPDNVELCLTDEIFNEINRRGSPEERAKNRQLAKSFSIIQSGSKEWGIVESELLSIFPNFKSESERSDIRHLAKAIAGDALYFITKDRELLRHSDEIYEKCQISVLRPSQALLELDQIERGHEYQPARLSGSQYQLRRINSSDLAEIVPNFLCQAKHERARDFENLLLMELANPRISACFVLESPSGIQQALLLTKDLESEVKVPIFRISRSPLSATIARHLLRQLSYRAVKEGKSLLTICDGFIDDHLSSLLGYDGFILSSGKYTKVLLRGVLAVSLLEKKLDEMRIKFPETDSVVAGIRERVGVALATKKTADIIGIERILWPAKIMGSHAPCFIVPIKPRWAKYLFDEHMASQDLFGSFELMFNAEQVFYRSKRPGVVFAPARLLWYVSTNKSYFGSGSIRAVSILDEVTLGKPKDLFTRNRRLGIYRWEDVIKTVSNDLEKDLMALRFSNTLLVEKPLPWKALQSLLAKFDIKTSLQSPLKIEENVFAEILKKTLSSKE